MEEVKARIWVLNLNEQSAGPRRQPSEGGGPARCAPWWAVGWAERSPWGPLVAGFGQGCEASLSQQAVWPGCAWLPGSVTEPAAPSWLRWFLCAGGAGVGEAAGALARSGLGTGVAAPPLP